MTVRKSLAIAMLGAMGAFGMTQPTIPTAEQQAGVRPSLREIEKYSSQGSLWNWPAHDGHSVAHGKRMAKKRRNQQRHRKAAKGSAR